MKKTKKEKGITLIALVVTIIILLILAGVSIQLAINKGLFDNVNKAKKDFQRAQVTEMLSLKLTGEQVKNPAGTAEELVEATRASASEDEELKKMGKKVTVDPKTSTEEDGKIVDVYFYVEVDEDVYKVDKTGAKFIGEKGKFPPVVIIENMQITSNSIKITVKTSRNDEGQIEIYKKSKVDTDYVSVKKDINENIVGIEQTISGLTQNETYSIKIVATATNGQTAEVVKDVTIGSVPNLTTADITFTYTVEGEEITEETWTNQDVTVTASTSIQGYILQTSKDCHTWSDEPSQTFEKNGTMYVALYDGTNYGGTATANIKNIDKLEPKDLTPSISVNNNKVIVDATEAKDAEATDDYGNSGISKVYFIEGSNETEESTKKYTCKNISGTNDTIKLKLVDNAGNEKDTTPLKLNDSISVITFNSNGGEGTMDNIVAMKNSSITLPQNSYSRNGYNFIGWTETQNSEELVSTTYKVPDHNVTLYAVWEGQETLISLEGAKNEKISIYKGEKLVTEVTLNSSGISTGNVTVPTGTVKFVGSISGYTKEVEITEKSESVQVMPDGKVLYWYGREMNGANFSSQKIGSDGKITKNENYIYLYGGYGGTATHSGVGISTTSAVSFAEYKNLVIEYKMPVKEGGYKWIGAISNRNAGSCDSWWDDPKNVLSSCYDSDVCSEEIQKTSLDISNYQGNYYPKLVAGGGGVGVPGFRTHYIYAVYLTKN